MKTNTIVAALISNDPVYRSSGIDHDIYDFLEESSNDLIRSYRLVPRRHNHDLEPITNTRVSPVSPILHFDVTEELVEDRGGTALMTSFNSIANNLSNQKDVAKEYVPYMSHEGLVSTIDARYVEPMYRLVRSRDLICIGDYGLSIILSASAGEGLLAALEYEIRVHALGENSQDVEVAIGTEYLSDFKRFAKDNHALSTDNSSKYKKWYKSSYLLRNNFIHKQAVPRDLGNLTLPYRSQLI